ncbi:MAG TPA: DUF1501 domain-containing protein [Propionibacteriaceae bacterium]|nr:DUF1501 domain-containing protein [Propionibacteriaceae bacterium]
MRAPYDPRLPLDGLTRRGFLQASGVVGAAALLAGSAGCTWRDVARAASTNPLPSGTPVLVLVTMYGGNDWLNTVIPVGDPAYHDARPDMSYTPDEVLALDDVSGLNPGLATLSSLWSDKKLAIVRGVGYPKPDRSHFRSMDIWQTGSPTTPLNTGWLGRWLDHNQDAEPLLGLSIGPVLPVLAVGAQRTFAALSVKEKGADPLAPVLAALSVPDGADTPARRLVASSYTAVGRVRDDVVSHLSEVSLPDQITDDGSLKSQLLTVAACIRLGAPTRCYAVSMGGFDTHAGEKATQKQLLSTFDAAVKEFRAAMTGSPRAGDVVLVAYSEFGRRVKANASLGTDHGTAGDVLVVSDRVAPGFHGDQPSLTDLDQGDLKASQDFRSVYAELLGSVLGSDPAAVVGPGVTASHVLR